MMKKLIAVLLLMGLLPFFATNDAALAQPVKYAQSGMPFLKIDVGGRAGMAGTQVGYVGDAMSQFYNPAGMSTVKGFDVMSSMTEWIADIKHYGIGAAYTAGDYGTFGVNVVWMDYGTFTRTVPTTTIAGYETQGTFDVSEYVVGVSYARQITNKFSVGGSIRYASQNLGTVNVFNQVSGTVEENRENSVNNIVLDFGTLFYPGFKDFRFGVSLRNFSNQSDYFDQRFELPLSFTFGVAMDVLTLFAQDGNSGNSKLTAAVDWVHPREYSERIHAGIEYNLAETLFLRGGYKFNYDEEGLTAGVGLKKAFGDVGLKLDYVYSDFGVFDSVQRFTVGIFRE